MKRQLFSCMPFSKIVLMLTLSLNPFLFGCEDTAPPMSPKLLWQPGDLSLTNDLPLAGNDFSYADMNMIGGLDWAGETDLEGGEDATTPPMRTALPRVVIDTPYRGLYTAETIWRVEGHIEDTRGLTNGMSIDGTETPLSADLNFSQEISLPHGPHIIESKAMIDGRMITTDFRTIVSGLHMPEEAPAYDSVAFQLAPSALNEIASRINEFMLPSDFDTIISNPVLSEGFGPCPFGFCDVGIYVNAWNPYFSDIQAVVTPQENSLMVSFTMSDFRMDWDGAARLSIGSYTGQGVMYAETIRVDMTLELDWTRENDRVVRVLGTQVSSAGVQYDFDDVFYQAMSSFGLPLDAIMTSMMESTFEELLINKVPRLTYEMITEDAMIDAQVPVANESVQLTGHVVNIKVNPQGLNMWYDLFAEPSVKLHEELDTRWFGDFESPQLGDSNSALALFNLDGMNNVLHSVWQAGGLDFTLPGERLGLTPEIMDQLIPNIGQVEVHVTGTLPPLLTHNEQDTTPWVTMGDVVMKVSALGAGADASLITVVTSIKGQLNMQSNGFSLIPELLMPEVYPTITQPTEVDPILALGLPTLLIPLVQEQLPIILAERLVFPIDLIRSYRLDNISAGAYEGLGYLLSGQIVER